MTFVTLGYVSFVEGCSACFPLFFFARTVFLLFSCNVAVIQAMSLAMSVEAPQEVLDKLHSLVERAQEMEESQQEQDPEDLEEQ